MCATAEIEVRREQMEREENGSRSSLMFNFIILFLMANLCNFLFKFCDKLVLTKVITS